MVINGNDPQRREALARLRAAVETLTNERPIARQSTEDNERLLGEVRAAIRSIDDVFFLVEHNVRGPLTVVKGRAQLLRRQAMAAPRPDMRLITGLNEVDAAVDRIVARLDRLLGPPTPSAGDPSSPFDEDGC